MDVRVLGRRYGFKKLAHVRLPVGTRPKVRRLQSSARALWAQNYRVYSPISLSLVKIVHCYSTPSWTIASLSHPRSSGLFSRALRA
jgi:hypothetical protein